VSTRSNNALTDGAPPAVVDGRLVDGRVVDGGEEERSGRNSVRRAIEHALGHARSADELSELARILQLHAGTIGYAAGGDLGTAAPVRAPEDAALADEVLELVAQLEECGEYLGELAKGKRDPSRESELARNVSDLLGKDDFAHLRLRERVERALRRSDGY
jgi:hypothetical protein